TSAGATTLSCLQWCSPCPRCERWSLSCTFCCGTSVGLCAGCLLGELPCAAASAAPPPTASTTADPATAALRPSMRLSFPRVTPKNTPLASGLRDAGFERGAERFAHGLQLDAVEHVLEEAAHDQALR